MDDIQPTAQAGWQETLYNYNGTQPHAVTSLTRDQSSAGTYEYDANGNPSTRGAKQPQSGRRMTCRVESGVTYKQTYNAENRISSIAKLATGDCSTPGNYAAKWDFTYDGDGVRTGQSYTPYTDGQPGTPVITRYYFGGAYETTGSAWKKYYAFAGQTVAMRDASGFKYFLSDHLGSVSVVLSATGTVLEQQRYLPFGQVRVMPPYASVTSTDFTYTGQRNLPDTGLMDYNARFYSPALGRFIQPDTIIPGAANPQSWNRFSYVTNRPINFNDPTGHREELGNMGNQKNVNCKKYGQYCTNGKPKSQKELAEMGKPKEKDKDSGGGLPGTNPDTPQCSPNDYECLIWGLIDQMADPYTGVYTDPIKYPDSPAMSYDLFIYDAYEISGWDLNLIAQLGINNPMMDENWSSAGVDVDYIHNRGGAGSTNGVYVRFLKELKLDPTNYNNYEANYLNAMMKEHNQALDVAKANFYNDLMAHHEGDFAAAYEWLFITKEVIGLPD